MTYYAPLIKMQGPSRLRLRGGAGENSRCGSFEHKMSNTGITPGRALGPYSTEPPVLYPSYGDNPQLANNQTSPDTNHLLIIAVCQEPLDKFTRAACPAFAWELHSSSGRVLASRSSPASRSPLDVQGKQDLPQQTVAALHQVPEGSGVYILSDEEYFTTELNKSAETRVASGYKKTDGKTLLAHAEDWRHLDALAAAKRLLLRAGRGRNEGDSAALKRVKTGAKRAGRSMSESPDDGANDY